MPNVPAKKKNQTYCFYNKVVIIYDNSNILYYIQTCSQNTKVNKKQTWIVFFWVLKPCSLVAMSLFTKPKIKIVYILTGHVFILT
jgi:hypothetical protein